MSVSRETTIWCDMCGDWERSVYSFGYTRRQLKLKGWTFNKESKEDFCPDCTELNKEKKEKK
jgi:hypothetical protein